MTGGGVVWFVGTVGGGFTVLGTRGFTGGGVVTVCRFVFIRDPYTSLRLGVLFVSYFKEDPVVECEVSGSFRDEWSRRPTSV